MAVFEKNHFVGQRIQVDGHRFIGNRFENCVLVYGGGPLNMVDNQLVGVAWEFVDAAARTIALISSFYQAEGESRRFVERLLATSGRSASAPTPTGSVTPASGTSDAQS